MCVFVHDLKKITAISSEHGYSVVDVSTVADDNGGHVCFAANASWFILFLNNSIFLKYLTHLTAIDVIFGADHR